MKLLYITFTLTIITFSSAMAGFTEQQCKYFVDDNVRLAKAQILTKVNCTPLRGHDFSEFNHTICGPYQSAVELGKLLRAHDEINSRIYLLTKPINRNTATLFQEISILGSRSPHGNSNGSIFDKIEQECKSQRTNFNICRKDIHRDQNLISIYNADELINPPIISLIDYGKHTSEKTQNFYSSLLTRRNQKEYIENLFAKRLLIKNMIDQAIKANPQLHKIQLAKKHVAHIVSTQCLQTNHVHSETMTCDDFAQAKKLDNPNIQINTSIMGSIAGGNQAKSLCQNLSSQLQKNLYTCYMARGGNNQNIVNTDIPIQSNGNQNPKNQNGHQLNKYDDPDRPSTLETLKDHREKEHKKAVRKEYYDNIEDNLEKISYVYNWKKNSGWRPPRGKEHLYHKKIVGYTKTGLAINEYSKRTPWKYMAIEAFKGFAKWGPQLIQMHSQRDQFKQYVDNQVAYGKEHNKRWACYNPSKFYNTDGSFNAELFEANCLNGNSPFYPNFSAPPFSGGSISTLTSPFGLGIHPSHAGSSGLSGFGTGFSFSSPSVLGGISGLGGI